MITLSFMSANYVARELGYRMTEGWGQGQRATEAYFRPLESYGERFDALLAQIQALGFKTIDLWLAHLNPAWATPEHLAIAVDLLAARGLKVVSLAGSFGETAAQFEAACRQAIALGAQVLGGLAPVLDSDRPAVEALLAQYDLRLGFENHPERSAQEVLYKIGDSAGGRIGVTLDTGWFGTHGYDAPAAIRFLARRLVHVHLKDVRERGTHFTCPYGEGVVPIEACVRALQEVGYAGGISIEHEPELESPEPGVLANLALVRGWLGQEATL